MESEFGWDDSPNLEGEVFEAFGIRTFFGATGFPEITSDIVQHSLLRANYLPSFNGRNPEMPPIFTSTSFTPEASKNLLNVPYTRDRLGFDYARFEQMRPDGHARHSGIPHPYAHAKLVKLITDNWGELSFLTQNQHSAIRPILVRDGRIFASEYPQEITNEESWESSMSRNADFHLGLDIRNFFPSIYTHSLNWVPYGVDAGKAGLSDKSHPAAKHFSNDLDKVARLGNRNQTIGLVVGPGSSNLLAEYLLSSVDNALEDIFGDRFRRHVDDYEFFAKSREDADKFQRQLEIELRKFELYLNPLKTKLTPLSEPMEPAWKVKASALHLGEPRSVRGLKAYWDAILLDYREHRQQVALRWAMGSILNAASESEALHWSISFLIDQIRHFPYLTPYLKVTLPEDVVLSQKDLECLENVFLDRFDFLYSDSRLWILTVLGLKGAISEEVISTIVSKGDPVTKCLLYEFRVSSSTQISDSLRTSNPSLHASDQNWLVNYQMFQAGDGEPDSEGYFEVLRDSGVDFISRNYLAPF